MSKDQTQKETRVWKISKKTAIPIERKGWIQGLLPCNDLQYLTMNEAGSLENAKVGLRYQERTTRKTERAYG